MSLKDQQQKNEFSSTTYALKLTEFFSVHFTIIIDQQAHWMVIGHWTQNVSAALKSLMEMKPLLRSFFYFAQIRIRTAIASPNYNGFFYSIASYFFYWILCFVFRRFTFHFDYFSACCQSNDNLEDNRFN